MKSCVKFLSSDHSKQAAVWDIDVDTLKTMRDSQKIARTGGFPAGPENSQSTLWDTRELVEEAGYVAIFYLSEVVEELQEQEDTSVKIRICAGLFNSCRDFVLRRIHDFEDSHPYIEYMDEEEWLLEIQQNIGKMYPYFLEKPGDDAESTIAIDEIMNTLPIQSLLSSTTRLRKVVRFYLMFWVWSVYYASTTLTPGQAGIVVKFDSQIHEEITEEATRNGDDCTVIHSMGTVNLCSCN